MQIIGSIQIVTVVTSVAPTFFSCIALFVFATFALLLFVLLALLVCAGGFRSCGSDHGLCPLDSHKPLIKAKPVFAAAQTFLRKASRLDRNFKCFGAVTFVWSMLLRFSFLLLLFLYRAVPQLLKQPLRRLCLFR